MLIVRNSRFVGATPNSEKDTFAAGMIVDFSRISDDTLDISYSFPNGAPIGTLEADMNTKEMVVTA